jgi:hypothetical protein
MSNRILTRDKWLAYCKEVADKLKADLTPKKVWISDMGGWFATESSCDIPYIRADIVDQLVDVMQECIDGMMEFYELNKQTLKAKAVLKILEE